MPKVAQALLEEFGRAVMHARASRGWKLNDVANSVAEMDSGRSGTKTKAPAQTFLSDIEKGKRSISPHTVGKLIHALDLPEGWLQRFLDSAPDATDEETPKDREAERLLRLVAQDDTAPATAEALLLVLAEEWAQKSFTDPADAYTALRGALQTAQDMKDQIDRLHNMDDRLAAVLRRVAEMNDRGETDAAGQELDAAIKAKEGELDALHEAALQQDRLRNRPKAAADRLIARLKAAAPPGGVFRATAGLLDEWGERGERMGDPFDLAVALDLAHLNHARASKPQLGQALLSLGNCHTAVGTRQSGGGHLTRAVRAYTDALKEFPSKQQPENWAMTQNNLGVALRTLGAREGDSARLQAAIDTYTAALTVYTPEAAPMDWAMTQMNLGGALQTLGTREGDSARLQAAIDAYSAALIVYTPEAAPMDWAGTQHNLAIACLSFHDLDRNEDWLNKAKDSFGNALKKRTREAGEYL